MDTAYSAAQGRSCTSAVWRQAVTAENATAHGKYAASLLWDLRKCYEYLRFHKLL